MMRVVFFILVIAVLFGAWTLFARNGGDGAPSGAMQIISSAFSDNQTIPAKYTCEGENVNPPLEIRGVPNGTQSIALIVDDPDAPGKTWVHWVLWNITAPDAIEGETVSIPENGLPRGAIEGRTSFNKPGYGGPCPPSGEHRYVFKAYAVNAALNLDPTANKQALTEAMAGRILDRAELVGRYRRK